MKFKQKYFQRAKEQVVEVKEKEPEVKQETPAVEETQLEPTKIKTLEELMNVIVQRHYDQIYKELLAYEKMLAAQIQAATENTNEKN